MERTEECYMTVYRPIIVKRNPPWPKYRLVCGEITRILSAQEPPERLVDGQWKPTIR
jgi:hypothetical protein